MTTKAGENFHLHFDGPFRQNYTNVILGGEGLAPLHPLAGTSPVPRVRPRGVLPREGRVLAGGQADLFRLPGPDRVPQLRAAQGRALRRVGRHERERTLAEGAREEDGGRREDGRGGAG